MYFYSFNSLHKLPRQITVFDWPRSRPRPPSAARRLTASSHYHKYSVSPFWELRRVGYPPPQSIAAVRKFALVTMGQMKTYPGRDFFDNVQCN
ncbi:hypothetical protein EVAR_82621_1 [Eumeta japonica]|uniref:Uncharacterized protein n=1 Tax=Eumeta variegata TaxID=151549 RepID=A0A4C1X4R7_EUMVA|nr:hypothetical protein EVAR_82621_1 [Eumeta japonica]